MFVPEDENITDDLVNLIANELLIWHAGRAGKFSHAGRRFTGTLAAPMAPSAQCTGAHVVRAIGVSKVSVLHNHSSCHANSIEIYRDQVILYGCGDFLNDYEGIQGYEDYRGDLPLMYFADIDLATPELSAVEIVPLQIHKVTLVRPSGPDVDWMRQTLDRENRRFGTRIAVIPPGRLALSWSSV